jgi:hypothetical protein
MVRYAVQVAVKVVVDIVTIGVDIIGEISVKVVGHKVVIVVCAGINPMALDKVWSSVVVVVKVGIISNAVPI